MLDLGVQAASGMVLKVKLGTVMGVHMQITVNICHVVTYPFATGNYHLLRPNRCYSSTTLYPNTVVFLCSNDGG